MKLTTTFIALLTLGGPMGLLSNATGDEAKPARVAAFPGAEGYGSVTLGGRGGKVIAVTNTNANGPGCLQAACDAKGPRIVFFKVAGKIDGDALGGRYRKNIIVDHVSASWSSDEVFSLYHNENVTIQWCMITEACAKADGAHRFGGIWGTRCMNLAERLIQMRDRIVDGGDDNQDRLPFTQHNEAVGHAVRATSLYAGIADLYAETGDEGLWKPLTAIWSNLVEKKLYITGGCGALYDGASPDGSKDQRAITRVHQAFGRNYQLPNTTAHNETCANIGNVLWNWKTFLVSGEAKHIDVMELALYNSVLSQSAASCLCSMERPAGSSPSLPPPPLLKIRHPAYRIGGPMILLLRSPKASTMVLNL